MATRNSKRAHKAQSSVRPSDLAATHLDRSRRSRSYWLELARKHRSAGDTGAVLHDLYWAHITHKDVMALVLRPHGLSASLRAKAVRR